ncbi:hypothetical protein MYSTI_06881 [Myxococcus stipitatus DSM 14675]|uniref:DUF2169 domain-containing protein n=1 Tax=Myxococcus stipitatus (strain DSM 14675 / JCM 12634 / Mx s8) TaxID=1278073 RepID=L7UNU0_MYXSD|nr:DUF2169 domain-containing protein [Myxococcus stipitatus]AGC48154.1 hypothetical protein MYSTI_06881 [Myxococcus stipitatus DSM 14675]
MNTPELQNGTNSTVALVPQIGMDGGNLVVVLIKQRFTITPGSGRVTRTPGAEVRYTDEPWDKKAPEASSIQLPSDVCIRKPSTDVLVVGHAMSKASQPVKQLDVHIEVGPVSKGLRVFGTRVWYSGALGVALGPAQPFTSVPLRWELAYGGFDASDSRKPPVEEPRNPLGRGVARDTATLVHQLAPQIEDPRDLISSPRTRPAPAGVGAIGRHWEPRRRYTGTVDEAWRKERMPLLPLDFDERHNQCAPPELICPEYLKGGEMVKLLNLSAGGAYHFALPRLFFGVRARTDQGVTDYRPVLDTVLLRPSDDQSLELTWRTAVPVPRPSRRLHSVQVVEKELR